MMRHDCSTKRLLHIRIEEAILQSLKKRKKE